MAMVKIFIEGENRKVPESEFLTAILNHMGIPSDKYEILPTAGYKNLMDSANASNIEIMQANTDAGGRNLVIFDADSVENHGGYQVRRDELLARKADLGLEFDLFLWPNNGSDGDVEVLMESIARKDLYPQFFDCFGKYEQCISKLKNADGSCYYTTPNRKSKLHTYFHSLPISNAKKKRFGHNEWCWDDPTIWNLDSESMNPIKEFLSSNLK